MPAVTVGLTVYNGAKYLPESVGSIMGQTYEDFECIAVLDGCTDNSLEIIQSMGDDRFKILVRKENKGLIAGLGTIIERSTTPYIVWQDHDDIMLPYRVVMLLSFMESHPDIAVCGTYFDYISGEGVMIGDPLKFPTDHKDIVEAMKDYTSIGGPTVITRKSALVDVGGFDAEYYAAPDLALWLKMIVAGYKFAAIPIVAQHYRVYDQQTSKALGSVQQEHTKLAYEKWGSQIWSNQDET